MRHSDKVTSTNANGYQSHAEANPNGARTDEGGGLLALICASLCKDTPLAEAFAPTNDNINNNNGQMAPLMSPVTNGEQIADSTTWMQFSAWLIPDALIYFTGITLLYIFYFCVGLSL